MIFRLMKNPSPAALILPFQPTLCPALPVVLGNGDYQAFEFQLHRIDQLLRLSDVENAQQEIVNVAKRLEAEGKIIISRGGEADALV